ncbi:MAG: ATP-binding protein [Treponemataceae bacterium]
MRKFPSIGQRILLAVGVSLALTVGVTMWGVDHIRVLGDASYSILKENYRSIVAAVMMDKALARQDTAALSFTLGEKSKEIRSYADLTAEFQVWLQRERENITIEGEAELAEAIGETYSRYLDASARLLASTGSGGRSVLLDETRGVSGELRKRLEELRTMNQETMYGASDKAQRIARRAALSMLLLGIAAVLAGAAFGTLLVRRITKPLRELTAAVEGIGAGNYDISVSAASGDELGDLAAGFNSMAAKIKGYHRVNIGRIVEEKKKNDAVIATIDDGVVIVDGSFRVTNANPAARAILGFEIDHDRPRHFLECYNDPALFGVIRETVESGVAARLPDEKRRLTVERGDVVRHFQFSIAPILDDDHIPIGTILLLRDVTKFRELDRLKTEFLMTASHELKTPLTSIRMSLDLLKEEFGSGKQKRPSELVEIASEEVARLQALIADVLDLSKIESGRIELQFSSISATETIDKAAQLLRSQIEDKGVAFVVSAPEKDFRIKGDVAKLLWVLTNLIANALRYTDTGGSIRLTAKRIGEFGHFTVADSGTGIAVDQLDRIFEKFVQLRDGRNAGGTGLGLAISREVVRAHGGTIWAESEVGKGSLFEFTIPLFAAQARGGNV